MVWYLILAQVVEFGSGPIQLETQARQLGLVE
jgi:exosome complex RNA-binding protein Csl4